MTNIEFPNRQRRVRGTYIIGSKIDHFNAVYSPRPLRREYHPTNIEGWKPKVAYGDREKYFN